MLCFVSKGVWVHVFVVLCVSMFRNDRVEWSCCLNNILSLILYNNI